jgi:hypothetical protein
MSTFEFTTDDSEDIVYFDYEMPDGKIVKFGVSFIEEDLNRKLMQDATDKKARRGRTPKFNSMKYRRALMNNALEDIKNATYKDLSDLTEPKWKVKLPEGKNWSDDVPYDQNVKYFIVHGMHEDLAEFLEAACREHDTFKQKKMAAEMKNLNPGSNSNQSMESTKNS